MEMLSVPDLLADMRIGGARHLD
ncbi:MAG: hypothetical protein JWR81_5419, partial [Pseudonocardia sp.]|nr:hypothetical protein [Pseudonocardia sp.]